MRVIMHVRRWWFIYAILLAPLIAVGTIQYLGNKYIEASIQSHETKAEKAEDKALVHEGRADSAKDQADAIDPKRIEAERRVEELKRRLAHAQRSLAERKRQLEEARNNPSIDRSGTIDEREQRLLAKLRALYPDR